MRNTSNIPYLNIKNRKQILSRNHHILKRESSIIQMLENYKFQKSKISEIQKKTILRAKNLRKRKAKLCSTFLRTNENSFNDEIDRISSRITSSLNSTIVQKIELNSHQMKKWRTKREYSTQERIKMSNFHNLSYSFDKNNDSNISLN